MWKERIWNKRIRKDLLLIFAIKILVGLFLLVEFNLNYPESRLTKGVAVTVGDTHTYLTPIENWIDEGTPLFPCRMPGHLLVYGPAYALLGEEWGKIALVFLQFVFTAISALFLARIAFILGGGKKSYNAVLVLYSLSTFVSLWDLVLSADSLSLSLLITAIYMLLTYRVSRQKWRMFVFGLAMAGSIFFRQIAVIILPLLIVHIYIISREQGWRESLRAIGLAAGLPCVMFSTWIIYNYQNHNKFIPLVLPLHECSGAFTMERMKVAEMLNNWGLDLIHWKPNSVGFWLNSVEMKTELHDDLVSKTTEKYNADSLISIKNAYTSFMMEKDNERRKAIGNNFILRADAVILDYRQQHPFKAKVWGRAQLAAGFLFPKTIDNLPLPSFDKMNWIEVSFKVFAYVVLILINLLAVVGSLYFLVSKKSGVFIIIVIPWAVFFTLAIWLGWIEQRYFTPIYPFFLVIATMFTVSLLERFQIRTNKPKTTISPGE